jgi:hypothetical protein
VETTVQAVRELGGLDPERLGVCLDACHLAAQFEDPARPCADWPGRAAGGQTPGVLRHRGTRPHVSDEKQLLQLASLHISATPIGGAVRTLRGRSSSEGRAGG